MIYKVFILLPSFFITLIVKSILYRKQQKICENQASEITAMSSILIIIISYFIYKKKNASIINLPTLLVSLLFFVANLLYFEAVSKLTPMIETICSKSNIIIVFILNFIFISSKIIGTQIAGLVCLLTSYIMISLTKEASADQLNSAKHIIIFTISAALEGFAFFNFDYFIVNHLTDFFHYVFLAQIYNLMFNLVHLLFLVSTKKIILFNYVNDINYYLIIILYVGVSAFWFCLSFTFELVPRVLITTVIYTLSDVTSEGILSNCDFKNIGWYALCVAGVLMYQYDDIRKYFIKENKTDNN
ncbi:hypothetical protein H312_02453 [Anncaliia algerae PRA339]|uniref:Sugar phosphate transporter domain-containing protein n=1 Tax=Anncaliia algerae PRA339 TaxID=1288291 RepID=A0A059EZL5_9MICR|nr:hypothetical protein H312_02453 [Anncaliia algerae PRA339]